LAGLKGRNREEKVGARFIAVRARPKMMHCNEARRFAHSPVAISLSELEEVGLLTLLLAASDQE
jgi:hypothetical protein